jgi:hypothetical protein
MNKVTNKTEMSFFIIPELLMKSKKRDQDKEFDRSATRWSLPRFIMIFGFPISCGALGDSALPSFTLHLPI